MRPWFSWFFFGFARPEPAMILQSRGSLQVWELEARRAADRKSEFYIWIMKFVEIHISPQIFCFWAKFFANLFPLPLSLRMTNKLDNFGWAADRHFSLFASALYPWGERASSYNPPSQQLLNWVKAQFQDSKVRDHFRFDERALLSLSLR